MTRLGDAWSRFLAWIPQPQRHVLIIFLWLWFVLLLFQPTFGLIGLPGSLERLPATIGHVGVASNFVGAVLIVVGQLWGLGRIPGKRRGGLICEAGGLGAMILGSALYSYALAHSATEAQRSVAYSQSIGFVSGCLAYLIWIVLYLRGGNTRQPDTT